MPQELSKLLEKLAEKYPDEPLIGQAEEALMGYDEEDMEDFEGMAPIGEEEIADEEMAAQEPAGLEIEALFAEDMGDEEDESLEEEMPPKKKKKKNNPEDEMSY